MCLCVILILSNHGLLKNTAQYPALAFFQKYVTLQCHIPVTTEWWRGVIFWLTCKKRDPNWPFFTGFLAKMSKILAFHFENYFLASGELAVAQAHLCEFLWRSNTTIDLQFLDFFKVEGQNFWHFGQKKHEKWPIWVPFFACESENVPSPSFSSYRNMTL